MWELDHKESWAFERIDAFELWCWRRLLRVPWTARRSNHSILKEINPEYSLEGLILKLKLQYFGPLMRRADSLEETRMLGKLEGKRGRERHEDEMVGWYYWLNGHEFEQTQGDGGAWWAAISGVAQSWTRLNRLSSSSSSSSREMVMDRAAWHAAIHTVTKNWTCLSDWTKATRRVTLLYLLRKVI